MIAYNNSDDTVSMLADYAKYMKKYTEMTKKMDDIESMDLNDAENLYVSESLYIRKKMYVKGFLCHGDRKYNCIC